MLFSARALVNHIVIANKLVDGDAEVRQPWLRHADADHFHIGDDGPSGQDGRNTGLHRVRVKPREAVELEIRRGVDHAPHDGPLLGGIAVRTGLAVNDGERIVLDLPTSLCELFGDGVVHDACVTRAG